MLAGVFVTAAYRAYLTSEFSVRFQSWPINGPEEILTTSYRLVTAPGTVFQSHIEKSPPTSALNRIFQADKVTYIHVTEVVDYVFETPYVALYGSDIRTRLSKERRCQVTRLFLERH